MNARFLSEDDRRKAVVRVRANITGIKSDEFKFTQLKEALLEIKCWALLFRQIVGALPNDGVYNGRVQDQTNCILS